MVVQVKSPDLPTPDQDTLHSPQCSACQTSLLLRPRDSSSWQASKLREPAARRPQVPQRAESRLGFEGASGTLVWLWPSLRFKAREQSRESS